jgi:hypothetical protein
MLSCRELLTMSAHYPDGQLSFSKKIDIRFHLLICKKCRLYMKAMDLTKATIKHLPLVLSDERAEAIVIKIHQSLLDDKK